MTLNAIQKAGPLTKHSRSDEQVFVKQAKSIRLAESDLVSLPRDGCRLGIELYDDDRTQLTQVLIDFAVSGT